MTGKKVKTIVFHVLVSIGGLIMVYPLLWMVLSSFKPTDQVLPTSSQLIPATWTLDNYVNGWKGFMGYTFGTFFLNSFIIAFTATFGTLISSAFVAYTLQRLEFKGKKLLFTLV
ncbi:MAG: carbohydrate ABC transporter permease, partial [Clostridia bacterium]|nr:carbohydrate ABC transporter permease [Clostridia bacterium]